MMPPDLNPSRQQQRYIEETQAGAHRGDDCVRLDIAAAIQAHRNPKNADQP
jgi:hypothetical protein